MATIYGNPAEFGTTFFATNLTTTALTIEIPNHYSIPSYSANLSFEETLNSFSFVGSYKEKPNVFLEVLKKKISIKVENLLDSNLIIPSNLNLSTLEFKLEVNEKGLFVLSIKADKYKKEELSILESIKVF